MKKFLTIATAGLAAHAIVAAGPAAAADVKVGSASAITGPIAELLVAINAARELAARHVNEQGGLHDGDRYVLVAADSQCDPKAAVDAGTKLVNVEQVAAIVGPTCSGATNAMAQSVTIPAGVLMLSDTATAPSISELDDNDLVFRISPSDAYQGRALAGIARDEGYRRLAITYANDDYNAGISKVFEAAFKEMGGTVTGVQLHEPDRASYRSELATLSRSGNPEALAVFAYFGSSGITILRNSVENGLFTKFLGADAIRGQEVIDQIGADTLRGNMIVSNPAADTSTESYARFKEAFEGAGGDASAAFVTHAYDAVFVMALAIEKAKSMDSGAIRDALRTVANKGGIKIRPGEWEKAKRTIRTGMDIDYVGASGEIEFDDNGDVAGRYSRDTVGSDGTWTATN